jgi:hypothetical protein
MPAFRGEVRWSDASRPRHAQADRRSPVKAEKLLHAIEVRIATLSALGNTLPGTGEGLTIAAGRFAFLELQMGMACYRELPQRPIIADFGPPDLQKSIEALL